jgi:integrase
MASRARNGEGTFGFDARRNQYYGVISLPSGKRKWFRDADEEVVRKRVRAALVELDRGLPIASDKLTLAAYLQQWLAGAELDRERRPNTLRGYRTNIERHIVPEIGKVRLGQLQPLHVQQLLRAVRSKGLSEKTVTYIHATLRVALADALELELLARNPAQTVRRRGRRRGAQDEGFQVKPLDQDGVRRLLEAARGEDLEALFTVGVALGLRRGEMLGLRWCDVDFPNRQLRVVNQLQRERGKGLVFVKVKTAGGERIVDVPDVLVEQLRAHKERQGFERRAARNLWQDRDLVFCSQFGTGIETTTLFRVWQRIRERAGIDVRLHDLRHTAASLLLAQGVELWQVSKILGHSSYQFTLDTYGHLYAATRREAADRMNRVLLGDAGSNVRA